MVRRPCAQVVASPKPRKEPRPDNSAVQRRRLGRLNQVEFSGIGPVESHRVAVPGSSLTNLLSVHLPPFCQKDSEGQEQRNRVENGAEP
jgi:hypothetical protein